MYRIRRSPQSEGFLFSTKWAILSRYHFSEIISNKQCWFFLSTNQWMSNIKEKMILKSSSFRPFGLLTISTVYSKSQDYSFCLQISRWWLELKGGNCLQLYRATRVCVTNSYIVCQVSRWDAIEKKHIIIMYYICMY
jgi:hypothetical protein